MNHQDSREEPERTCRFTRTTNLPSGKQKDYRMLFRQGMVTTTYAEFRADVDAAQLDTLADVLGYNTRRGSDHFAWNRHITYYRYQTEAGPSSWISFPRRHGTYVFASDEVLAALPERGARRSAPAASPRRREAVRTDVPGDSAARGAEDRPYRGPTSLEVASRRERTRAAFDACPDLYGDAGVSDAAHARLDSDRTRICKELERLAETDPANPKVSLLRDELLRIEAVLARVRYDPGRPRDLLEDLKLEAIDAIATADDALSRALFSSDRRMIETVLAGLGR